MREGANLYPVSEQMNLKLFHCVFQCSADLVLQPESDGPAFREWQFEPDPRWSSPKAQVAISHAHYPPW